MTIKEFESFIKRIEKIIEREESHLDMLYQKRIDLINNRKLYNNICKIVNFNYTVEEDINKMIENSEQYLDYYKHKLNDYINYHNTLINS